MGIISLSLSTSDASAGDPAAFSIDLPTSAVYGGDTVATCGWPTTVSMEGACTGTLVHPEVVIYAAHCGTGYGQVRFGESINGGAGRSVPTEFCKTYPGGQPGSGTDFAFCKLAQPVTDVAIVPILMGCETSILQAGTEVTIVGFGEANNGPYGIKRAVTTTINSITGNNEASIGGGGKDSCQGDSGGPVYVKLPKSIGGDDAWRVFGITSYGGACGGGGYYSMMHIGIQWFEQESGIDLTPCHDADGTWNPNIFCSKFPMQPEVGGGSWQSGCEPGQLSGFSEMCGPGANADPDDTPPTATILEPVDGTEYEDMSGSVSITIKIDAQDVGWGVESVTLIINGDEVGTDPSPPYEFPVKMPTGQWTIGGKATDYAGNVGYAQEIGIGVNTPAPIPDPTTGTSGGSESESESGGTSGGESGTGGTDGGSDGESGASATGASATGATGVTSVTGGSATTGGEMDEEGCACRSGGDGGPAAALGLLALAGLARRRRRG